MKKVVLTFACILPMVLLAQQTRKLKVENDIPMPASLKDNAIDIPANYVPSAVKPSSNKLNKLKNYSYVPVGRTFYDLQTNASIGRRIMMHPDGRISAVWTSAPNGNSGFPDRGTGYNFYDGTSWRAIPSVRLESSYRSGWPSIGTLANGSEFIMAHIATDGGYALSKNASIGSTSWTSTYVADDGATNPIWGRAAAGGNTIHLLSNYSSNDGAPVVVRAGVSNPTTYSRSKDGGSTWDILHTLLPGYDSSTYLSGGGDSYAIDVRDSVVAILIGGLGEDVTLWKSTDAGDNFTRTVVQKFPYSPYNAKAYIPNTPEDRAETNDGSLDVLIDNNNVVHAFWGLSYISDEDTTDTGYSFYPNSAALIHWAEGDTAKISGSSIDMDGNGTLSITPESFAALDGSGNLPGNVTFAARNGNTSLVTMPSAGIDANGNIYVVFSSPIEETYHTYNANFRDILINYSTDGGKSWNTVQNVTQERTMEANFACISKRNNNFVHLIFQLDEIPGTNLQNNGSTNLHPVTENIINYVAIPTSQILNNLIGQNTLYAKSIEKKPEVLVVSQNFPNPFDNQTFVIIYMKAASELTLTVKNVLGQEVLKYDLGMMNAGNHELQIDGAGLEAGVYFYTLETPENQVTRKMQVTK